MIQKLYLIRHGNTPGTESELMYGDTDLPLTKAGTEEVAAMAAAGVYPAHEGAAIYTSGMLRTEQTLRAIYGEVEHFREPLLREINLGKYEMMTVSEVMEDEYGRRWMMDEIAQEDLDFEGGDSHESFKYRTGKGIMSILEKESGTERIIVVIHGAVIAYIMERFFPGLHDNIWLWIPAPGSGYEIIFEDGVPVGRRLLGDQKTGVIPSLKNE